MSRRTIAAALAATLALSGCGALHSGPDIARPLVVVLFDVSGSTADPTVRARYLDAFERVVDHVEATHGTIVGDVIDDDPLAHSTFPIDATFEACDALADNKLVCDTTATRTREGVRRGERHDRALRRAVGPARHRPTGHARRARG